MPACPPPSSPRAQQEQLWPHLQPASRPAPHRSFLSPSQHLPTCEVRALARPVPSTWRTCPSCPPGSSRAQHPSGLSTGAPSSETLPGSPARVTVDGHESRTTHSRPQGSVSIRSRTEFSLMTHVCRIHSSGGGGGSGEPGMPRGPVPPAVFPTPLLS